MCQGEVGRKLFRLKEAGSGRNERADDGGRTSVRERTRASAPEVSAGKLRTATARTAEGQRCPGPGAALAAGVPRPLRPRDAGLASAAACFLLGLPRTARGCPGALPLGLAAPALRTRESRCGCVWRAAPASQVLSPSPEAGAGGRAAAWACCPQSSSSRAPPDAGRAFSAGEEPPVQPSRLGCRFCLAS